MALTVTVVQFLARLQNYRNNHNLRHVGLSALNNLAPTAQIFMKFGI
jgi:hypothetical protein